MINNSKYVSPEFIWSRLTAMIKNREFTLPEVAKWCADCVVYEIRKIEDMMLFDNVELAVSKRRSLVPPNMFRIVDVFYRGKRIQYNNMGQYLNFKDQIDKVMIRYYGVPIDPDSGYILIAKDQQKACLYYCMKMLYFEDFMENKLGGGQWQTIELELEDGIDKARGSMRNVNHLDEIELIEIMGNMVAKIGQMSHDIM